MNNTFGSSGLSAEIKKNSRIGFWAFEFDPDKAPRMYVDDVMMELLGITEPLSPEETYDAWYAGVDKSYLDLINKTTEQLTEGQATEVYYPWHHPQQGILQVRCGATRNYSYTQGLRVEGFHQNVSNLVSLQKENDEHSREFQVFSNYFVDTFVSAYYVNLLDWSCTIYKRTEKLSDRYPIISDYLSSVREYIAKDVHPDDREMMRNAVHPDVIKRRIKEEKEYSVMMRDIFLDHVRYFKFQVIRGADDFHAALGFIDITDEVTTRQKQLEVIEALASEFSAVYFINLNTEEVIPYAASPSTKLNKIFATGTLYSISFSTYVNSLVDENYRQEILQIGSIANLQEKLSKTNSMESIFLSTSQKYFKIKFVKAGGWENGSFAIMGFTDKDSEVRAEMEQLAVIKGLASDYELVCYVNAETMEDTVYSFEKIYSEELPNWASITNFTDRINLLIKYIIHPDDRDMFYNATRRNVILGELKKSNAYFVHYREIRGGDVNKTEYWRAKFVLTDTNPPIIVVAFSSVDKETRKQLETVKQLEYQQKELNKAKQAAEEANKAKSSFLFNMSHDIRTPLNAITGYTNLARRHNDNIAQVTDYLNKIDMAGKQLITLVNQVLDMSRIEAGKVVISEELCDVIERVSALSSITQANADTHGVKYIFHNNGIANRQVFADIGRINQILLNILGNAVKYTMEGGRVTLTIGQEQSEKEGYSNYIFIVEDTGIGMSKEFLGHIFEVFSREKNSTTSGIQGSGLGMAIVKKTVDLLHGTIELQSEQGKGTTVRVSIPLRFNKDTSELKHTEVIPDTKFLKGKRILLVEDNEMNREIAKELLEEHGLVVEEAEDGDIAVEKVQKAADRYACGYYSFILMDIQMPRMNGYEATKAIRGIHCAKDIRIPIIAMTANAFAEDKVKTLNAGMDAHLAKPIDINLLLQTLIQFIMEE